MMKVFRRRIVIISFMVILISAVWCSTVNAAPALSKKKVTVEVGNVFVLNLTNNSKTAKWKTSNKKASILYANNQYAVVKAKKKGSVIITVEVAGKKHNCRVTVKKRKDFPKKMTILVGDTITIKGKGSYNWAIQGRAVNSLTSMKGVRTIKLRAKATGVAKVIAEKAGKKQICELRVVNRQGKMPTSVSQKISTVSRYYTLTLSQPLIVVACGDTVELNTVTSSNDPSAKLLISNQSDKVSSIVKGNRIQITGKKTGAESITIKYGTETKTMPIIVTNAVVQNYDKNVKGINHRGYSTEAPENTIPAYVLSRKKGFEYVETDVSFTKDDVPVLLHDNTINRTARNSDGSKLSKTIRIRDITYSDVLQYDFGVWKGSQYKGTKIPSFEAFIITCKKISLHPYIELKSDESYTPEQIIQLLNIVRKNGMEGKVTWISFDFNYLRIVKENDKKARIGLVTTTVSDAVIETAKELQTEWNEVFIDAGTWTESAVSICYNAHIPLEVWVINSVETMKNLNLYITGVTSDLLRYGEVLYQAEMQGKTA